MARISTDRRGRTLAINTAVLSAGRLASKALVFLLVRFYTAVLTKEQFGTADLVINVANLLIPLACAGLSSGFFRFAAEAKSHREQSDVFSSGVCLLAVAAMLFALLSPLLMLFPHFGDYALLILIYVLCANVHYFVSDFVRAQGNFTLYAVQGLLNTALNIGFNFLFLLPLSMGVTGYVLSVIAADLCTSLFLIVRCRMWQYLRPGQLQAAQLRAMLRYCLPLIPASLCWWITNASDRYMVTHFCGEAANGLYAAAYKIPNLLTIICGIFLDAWQFSAVTEDCSNKKDAAGGGQASLPASLTAFFSRVFKGYSTVLILAAASMALLSKPISALLFDPSFVDAWQFVPVLLLACILSALGNFVGSVYMIQRRGTATLLTSMIGAVVNITLNLWLIPRQGALGAAIATAIAYLVVLVIRLLSTRRDAPFALSPLRLSLSFVLLCGLIVSVTIRHNGWGWVCAPLFALLLFINGPVLFHSVRRLLNFRR